MSWLEFISSIVKSIAWPIIVLIAVLALRKPVSQLILKLAQLKLKTIKYGEMEATFEDSLEDAEAKANISYSVDLSDTIKEMSVSDLQKTIDPYYEENFFLQIAEEAPYLGVFMSWHELEVELASVMKRLGDPLSDLKTLANLPYKSFQYLLENGHITKSYYNLFLDLRHMRNIAVHHQSETVITSEDAIRYRNIAIKVIRQLKEINPV
ncbi:hypothetical protein ACMX8W_14220 [Bacillus subtilis]|uniref:hypothetical protein n=1 Tax=Bacillus subtilis TaxID=1423 RepID=UPI00157C6F83|nr:hypothetical protein [Bacillus subtilis]MBE1867326.1 hypothetical protein [Bacillus subtilis]MEA1024763.1 hypothetical protein [Bacillus subtilis]NUC10802.1 hypothetical protein [Bacillus subtilis]